MTIFKTSSPRSNQTQVQTLEKIEPIFTQPLWKNQTLCFFWMQNRPNIGVYIVRTISNIFALALKKRRNVRNVNAGEMSLTYKQTAKITQCI